MAGLRNLSGVLLRSFHGHGGLNGIFEREFRLFQESDLDCCTINAADDAVPQHVFELLLEFSVLGQAFQCCDEVAD